MSGPPRPTGRREFEVAIICALGLESDAVEILFDRFWEGSFGTAQGDTNSYRTGIIGNHNVVLAYMPQMGKRPAATVSAHLRSSFENIKLALVVGVCGGVPEGDHGSIFLGDVVISESITNYDYGRRFPNGFISKEPAWTPNFRISSFLRLLRGWKGRHDLEKRTHYHHGILRGRDKKYSRPQRHRDTLFKPTYRHKHYPPQTCIICSADQPCKEAQEATCDGLQCSLAECVIRSRPCPEIVHDRRTTVQSNIHFGRVASGDTVMKSGEDRDRTAKQHAAIAFEMEGAGVYPNLQCIVVKGICDYADSHKDKLWQPFAAGIAAACMKAILEQWIGRTMHTPPDVFCTSPYQRAIDVSEATLPNNTLINTGLTEASSQDFSEAGELGGDDDSLGAENDSTLLQDLRQVESCFKETSSALRRSRRWLPRDTDVRRILKTQRAKFRTVVETLLSHATESPDDAQNMAMDYDHQGWQSRTIGSRVGSHLGSESGFCLEVVLEIQQKLLMVEDCAMRLGEREEANKGHRSDECDLDDLKDSLEDLSSLIRVFSSAIPERRRLELQPEMPVPTSNVGVVSRTIEHFRTIQKAANSLYDALGKSCTEHPLHNVHLSLQPRLNGTSTQVEFSVALGGSSTSESQQGSKSIWFNVESTIKSIVSSTEISSRSYIVTKDLPGKRSSGGEGSSRTGGRKRLRFHSICRPIPSPISGTTNLDIPDLFLQRNLCSVIQRQLHAQLSLCNNCIGIIGDSTVCRHLIYINPHAKKAGASASLSELISLSKRNSAKFLGAYDRVRLAKNLAMAVLYYHTTPWLSRDWRSEDVRFFGKADVDTLLLRSPEALPYITACVQAIGPERSGHVPSEYDMIIRNPVLFSLGVMLLELAYQAPFDELKHDIDLRHRTLPFANYVAAKRLAEEVNVQISASFKRIVKKCIDCDFGQDTDFQCPALQDAFYCQVISGLEELEKKLQSLQLDD
ncbi:5'-methylthioadenosine/S-adenosylhomocysteine nucleosidase family protein [Aspergillus lucknowensis]|uniref:Nucleoside phosphorylase domain-containing protein n=1 Tax=Aspergillus lucknowensis TaxID=176173 RepID=A0ABR4LYV7_9EURO